MRISVKITSWQDSWFPRFPRIDLDACYPKREDGEAEFDEDNFRVQVRSQPMVQLGSKDAASALAFGAILIQSVDDWLDANDVDDDSEKHKKINTRISKRLERGNYSYCRIDITDVIVDFKGTPVRGVKVNITTKDNDAFQKKPYEHDFAMIVADFCQCYSRKYENRGEPPLVFTESTKQLLKDLHELTEEADRRDAVRKSNEERLICERHRNGYCAPCKFDCPHYDCGKCVEIK